LHFIPLFDTGGTEKVVVDIYKGLDPARYTSHVCTFFPGKYDRLFAQNPHQRHVLVRKAAPGAPRPIVKALNFIRRVSRLRGIVRKARVDIVHTHHLGPLLHVYLLRKTACRNLPWVHTEHNVPDLAEGYAQPLFRRLKPLRGPAFTTGVSPNVCRFLETRCTVPAERIKLIANGVDIERFAVPMDRQAVRRELGLEPQDEVVGCIGNLRNEKNQRLAIEALGLLQRQRPRLKLMICGDGERRAELERLAASLNVASRTLFLGFRFDIPQILAAMDVFCLPSVYEGMPLSILEAWAAGRPVVATNVIGIRDLVTDGANGLLVPADDPRALTGALGALLDNRTLQMQLAENGRHLVVEQYSLRAMVAKYAGLYEELMGS
jgi:glycosyltransferase involved in cell wall biosynthesis